MICLGEWVFGSDRLLHVLTLSRCVSYCIEVQFVAANSNKIDENTKIDLTSSNCDNIAWHSEQNRLC